MTPALAQRLRRSVREAQHALAGLYRLELPVQAWRFLLSEEDVRGLAPEGGLRSGLLAFEERGALWLGLYLDPDDLADPDTVVEETSHFVCLAWHASQGRRVSALTLELQSEVDRYLLARVSGRDPLAHFQGFEFDGRLDPTTRERYAVAHSAGRRYCHALDARYPARWHVPALLAELRRFYRSPSETKLRVACAA